MPFLYFLEKIRTDFLNVFFSLITRLGEETVFLVLALIFFWCINKRQAFYILTVGLFGTLCNQILKLAFRVPRPWVKDPSFTIVESARAEATGYSFPSGHTQSSAGTLGAIAAGSRKARVIIPLSILIALVALSRMYLGVHTPQDVLVSLAVAAALVLLLRPFFAKEDTFHRAMPFIILGGVLLAVGFLVFVLLLPKEGLDPHNAGSGLKNACTLLGCTIGLVPMYFLDRHFIKFETKAAWYIQILKLALGFAAVLLVKSGLSAPLVALFGNTYVARAVRYFLIVIVAGTLVPLSFRYLCKLRIPALDRFGKWVGTLFQKPKNEQ